MNDALNENNSYVAGLAWSRSHKYRLTFRQIGAKHDCMIVNMAVKL